MEDKELKHEFELERVILFSDAVFAIILTIMVLDIKLPEGPKIQSATQLTESFLGLIPKFVAYIISFVLVGTFWVRHLKIFKSLKNYSVLLVSCNLLFLFAISLFPFAISTITGNSPLHTYWTFDIYLSIVFLALFGQTLLVHCIVHHKHELSFNPAKIEHTLSWKVQRLNYILVPLMVVLLVLVNVFQWPVIMGSYAICVYGLALKLAKNRFYPDDAKGIAGLFKKRKTSKTPSM